MFNFRLSTFELPQTVTALIAVARTSNIKQKKDAPTSEEEAQQT